MTPEKWKKLDALLDEALELRGEARAAFLGEACGGDEQLRKEAERLIAAHERESSFLDSPVFERTAELAGDDCNASLLGCRLGPYQIVSQLGRGGMGEVYLAEDSRLGRNVAIKLLPAEFTADAGRVRRFEQEARAASSLNHPNIITVYDIGEIEGRHYIVEEFIDGKTLRQRMTDAPQQRMEIEVVLDIAAQIAIALAAAHEVGIVHRDIKPENVMVRRDGLVKVLDFGLAKLTEMTEPQVSTVELQPLTLVKAKSTTGTVMGTVGYMSPEQARGQEVDYRTDIFSMGVMMYELLAGSRPFGGATTSDVVAAILTEEPLPISELRPVLQPELERMISRMLEKERDARYQSAAELRAELQRLRRRVESNAAFDTERSPAVRAADQRVEETKRGRPIVVTDREQIKRRWFMRPIWQVAVIGLVALMLASAGMLWWLSRPPATGRGPILTRLTSDSGLTIDPALSLDGKILAYASDRSGEGNLDIWVKQLSSGEPLRLTQGEADEREPTFSPDGSLIAFRSERDGGGIYLISSLGGEPKLIASRGRTPRFSPDGRQIAYWSGDPGIYRYDPSSWLYIVSSAGGLPRQLQLQPDFTAVRSPIWSPDGNHLLFLGFNPKSSPEDKDPILGWVETLDWWVTPLNGGTAIRTKVFSYFRRQWPDFLNPLESTTFAQVWITGIGNYTPQAWLPGENTVLFSARLGDSTNLWKIPLSPKTWQVDGLPMRVTYGTGQDLQPSIAAAGQLVFSDLVSNIDVWSLPLQANQGRVVGEPQRLTQDTARDYSPSVSADGKILVFLSERSGNPDIWKKDLETGSEISLTTTPFSELYPVITGDGTKMAYVSREGQKNVTHLLSTNRGVSEKIGDGWYRPDDWSSDGKWILCTFHAKDEPARHCVGLLDVSAKENIELLLHPDWPLHSPRFSPDESWIAFHAINNPQTRRIFIAPFHSGKTAGQSEWIAVTSGVEMDREPRWSPDGNLLYFISERDGFRCLWAQRLDPMRKYPLGSPFAVHHFHRSSLTNRMGDTGLIGLSVSRNKVFLSLEELTGNIWMTKLD